MSHVAGNDVTRNRLDTGIELGGAIRHRSCIPEIMAPFAGPFTSGCLEDVGPAAMQSGICLLFFLRTIALEIKGKQSVSLA
jgi:hypothetical protein